MNIECAVKGNLVETLELLHEASMRLYCAKQDPADIELLAVELILADCCDKLENARRELSGKEQAF